MPPTTLNSEEPNYCQDSNKKLSVPLNKLVTHPTALT